MLNSVEHEKSFITSGPGLERICSCNQTGNHQGCLPLKHDVKAWQCAHAP